MMPRLSFPIPLLILLLLVAGCTLHAPQAIEPPHPLPAAFLEGGGGDVFPGRWWETFGDPRLDALMAEAFTGNLDLAQAVARLDQLQALSRQAEAGRRPTLNVEGRAGREGSSSFGGDAVGTSYRLSLAAAFEVDLWNKIRSRRDAARLEEDASREEVAALYLRLSAQVADLYYLAVEQRAQLVLADSTIAAYLDALARVEDRYREGLVPALDVYQARQNLAAARARRPLPEAGAAQAEHALAVLLGRFPQAGLAGTVVELPTAPEAFAAGLPSELLARRPDVTAALLRLRASDARIGAAIAERFPSFNLLGTYGYSSTPFGGTDISGDFWSLLLQLAAPVLDGGRRRAEVERSRALFRENLARYHLAVLGAVREVEDALSAGRATEARIAFLAERQTAAEATLRLSTERYRQGLSDYLPVLTAQTLHFEAQSQLIAARRQLIADRVTLARALGGDWMMNVPVVSVAFEAKDFHS